MSARFLSVIQLTRFIIVLLFILRARLIRTPRDMQKFPKKPGSAVPITFLFQFVHEKKIEPKRWSVSETLTYFVQLVQCLSAFSL